MPPFDLSRLASLMVSDPCAAADEIDALVGRLQALAAGLRASRDSGVPTSGGGMGDRARLQVVGPDGRVKQTADTGEVPL